MWAASPNVKPRLNEIQAINYSMYLSAIFEVAINQETKLNFYFPTVF
jgi:hypothetical protein